MRLVSRSYPAFIANTHSCDDPKPSPYLRISSRHEVFAGCCQPLLGVGLSRRYLRESFSTCKDPYPGCFHGAFTRFFPQDYGLPDIRTRSAHHIIHTAISVWYRFRGCSHSLMLQPADLLAPQIAPTAEPFSPRQPELLLPRIFQSVTSLNRGYANRPLSGN